MLSGIMSSTRLETVVVTQFADLLGKWISGKVPPYHLSNRVSFTKTMRASRKEYADPIINQDDLALLQYTSGTEGVPKGVMLSHKNLLANTLQTSSWASVYLNPGEETVISALPLCHIFGFMGTFLVPLKFGARNVLAVDGRDKQAIVTLLATEKFSILVGVSTYFNSLVKMKEFANLDFSSLKLSLSGGMSVHTKVLKDWSSITGMPIIECYGMTETSPAITMNPIHLLGYNGTVGLPLPSTEISIRDLRGNELGVNSPGELWVKGPQVMEGYWGVPDRVSNAVGKEGWFKTGDVAVISEQGYVTMIDRIRDIVNVSGFVVYPSEVEEIVMKHRDIKDAAVVAVEDEHSGEAVKLFVVPRKKGHDPKEAIMTLCKSKLSGYKCPKHIEVVERIPRLKSGRLLRRELRKPSNSRV
ncbi:UNVERIFIED_CONTAM: hypothetical protein GTU68_051146 [Idotea baltica]|nr:hypothetical protein [Idotea baltica]